MHKLINESYLPILNIYSKNIPDFLLPFFQSSIIQRLANISQWCWTEYCKYFDLRIKYSRLDHSLWVANIIWNFTKDKRQTLAWFFHDISHTVFSHVWDFLLWDAVNQESSEQYITKLLQEDEIIVNELNKLWIKIEEVDDYSFYTIAENIQPQLSADRLEYTIGNIYDMWHENLNLIKDLYDDLIILNNEKWELELWFQNFDKAKIFWDYSIKNCEWYYSSYESVSAMAFLGEIFKKVINEKLITHDDLYKLKDSDFISLLESWKNQKIKSMWEFYKNLDSYRISRYKPETDKYFVSSKAKKRFIDPLIKTQNWLNRLSNLSQEFVEKRDYHINRKEEWIILNYKIWNN
jgi:uncharacterized protein